MGLGMFMQPDQEHLSAEEGVTKKTVLVVEDDTGIGSFLVQTVVQETPYQALLVTDGFAALRVINDIKPDLFILDYLLPRMNGIELYDQLRMIQGLEDIPAIMISARLPKHEIEKRSLIGMSKPFELGELLDTIEHLIEERPHKE